MFWGNPPLQLLWSWQQCPSQENFLLRRRNLQLTCGPRTAWQREPTVTNRPQTAWYRNPQLPKGLKLPGTRTNSYHLASNCLVQEPKVTTRPQTARYKNQQLPSGLETSCNSLCNCLIWQTKFSHIYRQTAALYILIFIFSDTKLENKRP
jgi:hypothetical protein